MWRVFYIAGRGSHRVWRPFFTGTEVEAKARYAQERSRRKTGHVFLVFPKGKPLRFQRARPARTTPRGREEASEFKGNLKNGVVHRLPQWAALPDVPSSGGFR
jgi:hypothetical protein